jgi:hypothetical protein
VGRALGLTEGYRRSFIRLSLTWTPAARRALLMTLHALSSDPLPGALDYPTLVPPTLRTWVRRVPGQNLWVHYTFTDVEVRVRTLTNAPPVPLDE